MPKECLRWQGQGTEVRDGKIIQPLSSEGKQKRPVSLLSGYLHFNSYEKARFVTYFQGRIRQGFFLIGIAWKFCLLTSPAYLASLMKMRLKIPLPPMANEVSLGLTLPLTSLSKSEKRFF